MALETLLLSNRDPVPTLNTFARQYGTEALSPRGHQSQSCTVEDALRSIGKELADIGAPDLASQVKGGYTSGSNFNISAT